mmetsp:Transcript_5549/g.18167  ORF Transcript_5549/g.18167 Transcript_5549/m.18167 type:complete len:242 (+) Transcript_5549:395-1120(+)
MPSCWGRWSSRCTNYGRASRRRGRSSRVPLRRRNFCFRARRRRRRRRPREAATTERRGKRGSRLSSRRSGWGRERRTSSCACRWRKLGASVVWRWRPTTTSRRRGGRTGLATSSWASFSRRINFASSRRRNSRSNATGFASKGALTKWRGICRGPWRCFSVRTASSRPPGVSASASRCSPSTRGTPRATMASFTPRKPAFDCTSSRGGRRRGRRPGSSTFRSGRNRLPGGSRSSRRCAASA